MGGKDAGVATELKETVGKAKEYKVPEFFKYNQYSYFDVEKDMEKQRVPQVRSLFFQLAFFSSQFFKSFFSSVLHSSNQVKVILRGQRYLHDLQIDYYSRAGVIVKALLPSTR